jgi:ABC-type amino acid transport system permease subunit
MSRRVISTSVVLLVAALLLGSWYVDYLTHRATGRPVWWFILEILVAVAAMSSVVFFTRGLQDPRLRSITGLKAVVGILIVVAPQIPTIYAGVSLDEYLGFDLRFAPAFSATVLALSIRTAAMLARDPKSLPTAPDGLTVVSTAPGRTAPPN